MAVITCIINVSNGCLIINSCLYKQISTKICTNVQQVHKTWILVPQRQTITRGALKRSKCDCTKKYLFFKVSKSLFFYEDISNCNQLLRLYHKYYYIMLYLISFMSYKHNQVHLFINTGLPDWQLLLTIIKVDWQLNSRIGNQLGRLAVS